MKAMVFARWPASNAWCAMVSVTPDDSSNAVLMVGSGHGPMVVKGSTTPAGEAVIPLDRDPRPSRARRKHGAIGVEGQHQTTAVIDEVVGDEALREVDRLVVSRRRPDVGDPVETREQAVRLGQASVERRRPGRPRDPRQAVPERLAIRLVVEQDGVPEVTDDAPEQRARTRLVPGQPAHVGRRQVARSGGPAGRGLTRWLDHARTIPGAGRRRPTRQGSDPAEIRPGRPGVRWTSGRPSVDAP